MSEQVLNLVFDSSTEKYCALMFKKVRSLKKNFSGSISLFNRMFSPEMSPVFL